MRAAAPSLASASLREFIYGNHTNIAGVGADVKKPRRRNKFRCHLCFVANQRELGDWVSIQNQGDPPSLIYANASSKPGIIAEIYLTNDHHSDAHQSAADFRFTTKPKPFRDSLGGAFGVHTHIDVDLPAVNFGLHPGTKLTTSI
ncbi:hypothetical protein LXL04_032768 [Taraxacum kok-saghyz]